MEEPRLFLHRRLHVHLWEKKKEAERSAGALRPVLSCVNTDLAIEAPF